MMLFALKHQVRYRLRRPTQRAADKWESARFLAGSNAPAGFRFRALCASHPLAANANR